MICGRPTDRPTGRPRETCRATYVQHEDRSRAGHTIKEAVTHCRTRIREAQSWKGDRHTCESASERIRLFSLRILTDLDHVLFLLISPMQ